eukprot:TRINITY_DN7894_c0_g1_i11.p1 TRINITY_DN7894_c0_g1~~TRINITY_DN7894_c0_g1_i11.p1  ORF type:complete len:283 (+),score=92.19 TRINITY_DN7894_c0_g1_i11:529-1377(+)
MLEMKTLIDNTAPYLPKPEIEILTQSNINGFLEDKPDKPKILLFSNKKAPSFMLKAIAHTFYDTMCVGFVQNSEDAIVKKYKVTEYPALILVRRKNEKPVPYKGEIKLNNIFDFLNVYAEKFVTSTMKDKMKEEGEKLLKPWLSEDIPELTRDSIGDICLNTGKLCVIYLTKNELDENTRTLLKLFKEKHAAENRFAYMWLNAELEKSFFEIFQLEQTELPKLAFLNTGSFKRALIHQGEMTEKDLQKTFDSILGADARFVRLSAKTLPELTLREAAHRTDL